MGNGVTGAECRALIKRRWWLGFFSKSWSGKHARRLRKGCLAFCEEYLPKLQAWAASPLWCQCFPRPWKSDGSGNTVRNAPWLGKCWGSIPLCPGWSHPSRKIPKSGPVRGPYILPLASCWRSHLPFLLTISDIYDAPTVCSILGKLPGMHRWELWPLSLKFSHGKRRRKAKNERSHTEASKITWAATGWGRGDEDVPTRSPGHLFWRWSPSQFSFLRASGKSPLDWKVEGPWSLQRAGTWTIKSPKPRENPMLKKSSLQAKRESTLATSVLWVGEGKRAQTKLLCVVMNDKAQSQYKQVQSSWLNGSFLIGTKVQENTQYTQGSVPSEVSGITGGSWNISPEIRGTGVNSPTVDIIIILNRRTPSSDLLLGVCTPVFGLDFPDDVSSSWYRRVVGDGPIHTQYSLFSSSSNKKNARLPEIPSVTVPISECGWLQELWGRACEQEGGNRSKRLTRSKKYRIYTLWPCFLFWMCQLEAESLAWVSGLKQRPKRGYDLIT